MTDELSDAINLLNNLEESMNKQMINATTKSEALKEQITQINSARTALMKMQGR